MIARFAPVHLKMDREEIETIKVGRILVRATERSWPPRHSSGPIHGETANEHKKQDSFFIFDMRKSSAIVAVPMKMPLSRGDDFAVVFNIDKHLIHKRVIGPNVPAVLVIAANRDDKFLLIHLDTYPNLIMCMQNRSGLMQRDIITSVLNFLKQPLSHTKYCLLVDNNRINEEVPALSNMSQVRIVMIKPLTIQIIFQYELFREKRFTVRCENLDSLTKLKEIFLQELYSDGSDLKNINSDSVWLTGEEQVLTEGLLLDVLGDRYYEKILSREQFWGSREYISQQQILEYCISRHDLYPNVQGSKHCYFTLYAYIQTSDAVAIKVNFPSVASKTILERPLVVSPNISPQDLRNEVAKVVKQRPAAIKLKLKGKKIDVNLNLQKALHIPNCVILVELKQKIMINVDVIYSDSGRTQVFNILLYSYDFGYCIQSELYQKIHFKPHYVDILFEGRPVAENKTLSENRIRNNDKVQAIVFKNRVFASVRTIKKLWIDLVIDDCHLTMVKDLKMFVQGYDKTQNPAHDSEIMVIFQHTVLEDHLTLASVGIHSQSQDMNEQFPLVNQCEPVKHKFVLVQIENRCFSAASSCNGQLAVFRDLGGKCFQYIVAMVGGKKLFYDPDESPAYVLGEVESMLVGRRKFSSDIQGIKLCSEYQRQMLIELLTDKRLVLQNRLQLQSKPMTQTNGCQCTLVFSIPPDSGESKLVCKGTESICSLPDRNITEETVNTVSSGSEHQPKQLCLDRTPLNTGVSKSPLSKETGIVHSDPCNYKTKEQLQTECIDSGNQNENDPYLSQDPMKSLVLQESKSERQLNTMHSRPKDFKRKISTFNSPAVIQQQQMKMQSTSLGSTTDLSSDSEAGWKKRQYTCSTTAYESLEESEDGTWTAVKSFTSEMSLPANFDEKKLNSWNDSSPTGLNSLACTSKFIDTTYKYIKRNIILEVARRLHQDDIMVIRELEVSEESIEQATTKYQYNLQEKYLYCLQAWCQSAGDKANKGTLIAALKRCGRNDLVERINELDTEPETC